ncbi:MULTISPECIES: DUF3899 domain-containing protein [unclassified Bacillus (in: firmicutes)]|uniref:DUF3899 domain-containing protein n=1 Tax=unclassified Bacillus (in: firmicutes) TaxID=185979 RepID=UPI000BEFAA2D|nr:MULTISPECIES: DUF3899 domain-containing protein [unclassified Bacillus (in: firmicutes)]PEJ60789.1 transporter [Bacillus sp. AFS002410]PEK99456.1 transporter [Bacillus sp. AFS017336]
MAKHYIISVFSGILLAAIISLTQGTLHFFLHFTNVTFYIGLTLFVIGGFLLIVQSGFFNITRFGMRKVFGTRDKQMAEMTGDETLTVDKDMIYRRYNFSITKPLLWTSITLVIISYLFSFIIIY